MSIVMRPRKRGPAVTAYPPSWVVETETEINGRHVTAGTELTIEDSEGRKLPGRYRFDKRVLNTANGAEWISVIGGPKGTDSWRDFRPGQVRTVHRPTGRR